MKRFFLAALFLFLFSANGLAETIPQIIPKAGNVEILTTKDHWQPLDKKSPLTKGFEVRTTWDSAAEIAFNEHMQSTAELAENSHLIVLDDSAHELLLQKGAIFILLEEKVDAAPLVIRAGNIRVKMTRGGCYLKFTAENIVIKALSEDLTIETPEKEGVVVKEGFKYFISDSDHRMRRMNYGDYSDWQSWLRKWYEKKDDFFAL
jgi:hypothetical protein